LEWQAWFTIGLVGVLFITLARNIAPPDVTLLGGAVLLTVVGIIEPAEAFHGLTNPGMLTVAALFVVSAGLRETGALDRIGGRLLGGARSERGAVLRLAPQVTALSAFMNNTAVVAMLVSVVTSWCRRYRVSPSRLLIPLSYLSILGGICTLIGTSTNLVVFGLMAEHSDVVADPARREALRHVSLFDFAYVGVPLAVVGMAYLMFIGRRRLPNREDLLERLGESSREYVVEMVVRPECALVGKTIEAAGLRRLPGLFLIEVVREGRVIAPAPPTEVILAGDRLTFAGVVSTIVDLERIPGLVPTADEDDATSAAERRQRRRCEAVVSSTSPLIGKNIREANFRALYNAAVVAVHRGGARLSGRIGDIVLRSGDTLLLQTGAHFAEANRNNPDFYLVSPIEEARPVRHERALVSVGLLGLLILLLVFGERLGIPTHVAAFLVGGLMIVTRCISPGDARRSVNWDVLLTIVAAFGIGAGLEKSGAARGIAEFLTTHTQAWGPVVALAVTYGITSLFTELITNNAAAVLVFPIAMSVAEQLGVSPRPFAFAIAYAASSSFATPFGYQTNLMVYGPGGYRFMDFFRVGVFMNLLLWATAVLVIPLVWPFELS
jgi:di/tricarboxylate transporter